MSQSNTGQLEGSVLRIGKTVILFSTEDQLAQSVGEEEWIMPCGHDCCMCDRECNKG